MWVSVAAAGQISFNSRPPRGGRHGGQGASDLYRHLSIHDLQEEVDREGSTGRHPHGLSIHDLQEEVDMARARNGLGRKGFQFTTSKRRSTGGL